MFFSRGIAGDADSQCCNVAFRYDNRRLDNLRSSSLFFDPKEKVNKSFIFLNYFNNWCVGINWSNRVVVIIWHFCGGGLTNKCSNYDLFRGLPDTKIILLIFLISCLEILFLTFMQDIP